MGSVAEFGLYCRSWVYLHSFSGQWSSKQESVFKALLFFEHLVAKGSFRKGAESWRHTAVFILP